MVITGKLVLLLFWFRLNYDFNCYSPWILPLKDDGDFCTVCKEDCGLQTKGVFRLAFNPKIH